MITIHQRKRTIKTFGSSDATTSEKNSQEKRFELKKKSSMARTALARITIIVNRNFGTRPWIFSSS